jgi:DNA (cytosine-5)-methyltransferase 1
MKIIRIGTDCSGIDAPLYALKNIDIPYHHIFSCEIDKYAKQSMIANHNPQFIYDNMTESRKLPKIDIYVCGFPCTTFSLMGKRQGTNDIRGTLFYDAIKAIKQSNPSIFILENVKAIKTINKGEFYTTIQNTLSSMPQYKVYYNVLNTKDYGIPQNRERLYIVGIRRSCIIKEFVVPPRVHMNPITDYIDYSVTQESVMSPYDLTKSSQWAHSVFTNPQSLRPSNNDKYKVNPYVAQALMASYPPWCVPMKRKATVGEMLSLQGFPQSFKQVVSFTQLTKQIGNAMSVNVLEHLFIEIFKCVDIDTIISYHQ